MLDIRNKGPTFTNAGVIEPLLKREQVVVFLEAAGSKHPLGMTKDEVYEERKVRLQSGDVLVLMTDGVIEEQNSARELYGEEALKKLIEKMDTSRLSAKAIKEEIIREVKQFSQRTQQDDDMTVVVIKVI